MDSGPRTGNVGSKVDDASSGMLATRGSVRTGFKAEARHAAPCVKDGSIAFEVQHQKYQYTHQQHQRQKLPQGQQPEQQQQQPRGQPSSLQRPSGLLTSIGNHSDASDLSTQMEAGNATASLSRHFSFLPYRSHSYSQAPAIGLAFLPQQQLHLQPGSQACHPWRTEAHGPTSRFTNRGLSAIAAAGASQSSAGAGAGRPGFDAGATTPGATVAAAKAAAAVLVGGSCPGLIVPSPMRAADAAARDSGSRALARSSFTHMYGIRPAVALAPLRSAQVGVDAAAAAAAASVARSAQSHGTAALLLPQPPPPPSLNDATGSPAWRAPMPAAAGRLPLAPENSTDSLPSSRLGWACRAGGSGSFRLFGPGAPGVPDGTAPGLRPFASLRGMSFSTAVNPAHGGAASFNVRTTLAAYLAHEARASGTISFDAPAAAALVAGSSGCGSGGAAAAAALNLYRSMGIAAGASSAAAAAAEGVVTVSGPSHELHAAAVPPHSRAGGGGGGSFNPLSCRGPVMRAFHVSWLALLLAFFSAFAPAAMLPVLTLELRLSKAELAAMGAASLLASLAARLLMTGWVRQYGPRYCQALTLLLTAPALACTALVGDGGGFITTRFTISLCMGTCLVSNFWIILVFPPSSLGAAIATCNGWGHAGCGLAMIVMPLLYKLMLRVHHGNVSSAWRSTFYFPAGAHLLLGALTLLLSQDTPQGDLLDWHAAADSRDGSGSWGHDQKLKQRQHHSAKRQAKKLQRRQQEQQKKQKQQQQRQQQERRRQQRRAREQEREEQPQRARRHPGRGASSNGGGGNEDRAGWTEDGAAAGAHSLAQAAQQVQGNRAESASLRGWSSRRRLAAAALGEAPAAAMPSQPAAGDGGSGPDLRPSGGAALGSQPPDVWRQQQLQRQWRQLQQQLLREGGPSAATDLLAAAATAAAVCVATANSGSGSGSPAGSGSPGSRDPSSRGRVFFASSQSALDQRTPPGPAAEAYEAAGSAAAAGAAAEVLATAMAEAASERAWFGRQSWGTGDWWVRSRLTRVDPGSAAATAAAAAAATAAGVAATLRAVPRPSAGPPTQSQLLPSAAAGVAPPPPPMSPPKGPSEATDAAAPHSRSASPPPLPPPAYLKPIPDSASGDASDIGGSGGGDVTAYFVWRHNRLQLHSTLGSNWRDAILLYGIALRNYRCLLLALASSASYGAQLALYNLLTLYLYDRYGMSFLAAGALAATPGLLNAAARPAGEWLSGCASRRFGMRGRLWLLWAAQAAGGLCCALLGRCGGGARGLAATSVLLALFAVATQIATGATFAVVPYVSFRAYAAALSVASSGGELGGALLLVAFFSSKHLSYQQGLLWMGAVMLAVSAPLALLRFPMWGGMLSGPVDEQYGYADVRREEQYYLSEWTPAEQASGAAAAAVLFAARARCERGPGGDKFAEGSGGGDNDGSFGDSGGGTGLGCCGCGGSGGSRGGWEVEEKEPSSSKLSP